MNISVSEFAKAIGVTPQAVYKRLSKDLKEFAIREGGKWFIDSAALDRCLSTEGPQTVESCEAVINPVDELKAQIELLQHEITLLTARLEASEQRLTDKDQLIKTLTEQIEEKDRQLVASAERQREAHLLSVQLSTTVAAMQKDRGIGGFFRRLLPSRSKPSEE